MGITTDSDEPPGLRPRSGRQLAPEQVAWMPDAGTSLAWAIVGTLLGVAGIVLFAGLYAVGHGGDARASDVLSLSFPLVAGMVVAFAAHELLHGLAMRALGARPRFGVTLAARFLPSLYTTAPGARFTRWQYLSVELAPLVIISAVGALLVALEPFGGALVLPLAAHLGGCVGDIWLAGLTLRQPSGTRVEDQVDGVVFFPPASKALRQVH